MTALFKKPRTVCDGLHMSNFVLEKDEQMTDNVSRPFKRAPFARHELFPVTPDLYMH